MSRYIDAEILKEQIKFTFGDFYITQDIIDVIEDSPTADVVEVVRCEDCKYAYRHPAQGFFRCSKIEVHEIMCSGSHFCGCGIKRRRK